MYRKLKMLEYKRSYNLPFSLLIPNFERVNSGTGREWKKSIPKVREREGNEKNPFPKFGNGKGIKKIHSQNSGTGKGMKKSIPKVRERESKGKMGDFKRSH